MILNSFFIAGMLLLSMSAVAQSDSKPPKSLKWNIREENGKIGMLETDAGTKTWYMEPMYDKVTGVDWGNGREPAYYKFWKGKVFDLVLLSKTQTGYTVKKIAENISDAIFTLSMEEKVAFQSNGKWGFFYDGEYSMPVTIPALYDTPPKLIDGANSVTKYFVVTANRLTGLVDVKGDVLIEPGDYSSFMFENERYITIIGNNGLKGYQEGKILVKPQYISFEYRVHDSYSPIYFISKLPDGSYHVRNGVTLLNADEKVTDLTVYLDKISPINKKNDLVILGDMLITVNADNRGKILKIGSTPINKNFSAYSYDLTKKMSHFVIDGERVFYFESKTGAIICPVTISEALVVIDMNYAGDSQDPGAEVLVDSSGKLLAISVLSGKRWPLPFIFNQGHVEWDRGKYYLQTFFHHANIVFSSRSGGVVTCTICKGEGVKKEKKIVPLAPGDEYEIIERITGYKEERIFTKRHTTGYDVTVKKVPITVKERVKKSPREEVKLIPCEYCNKTGSVKISTQILWDGKKFVNL